MERQIPKNVRQIGNVSDSPKIYVEDYVDTFFAQLCDKATEGPIGAFLVGELQKTDEEEYVYIYGAIQMHELKLEENDYVIDDETWKNAYEDCKQYFEDGEMLGWFVAREGAPLTVDDSVLKLHKKSFPKENTILILKEPVEKEESYFVHKLNDLMEIGGHYTYYEKNPCMQNYMISCRKKNGVCPSETYEDRAAKDFRSLVRSRGEQRSQKRTSRLMYGLSACLVLVVIVMGVTMLNNYDKMNSVEKTLNSLNGSAASDAKEVKAQETSGNVTAAVDENPAETAPAEEVKEIKPEQNVQDQSVQTDSGQADGGQAGEVQPQGTSAAAQAEETTVTTPAAQDNGGNGVYVVEQGDTLAIISKKTYGDVSHVDAICKMNGLSDGNLIYIGQKLLLP